MGHLKIRKIGFLMDPLESIKLEKDTSYLLMKGAEELGHKVYHIDQNHLELQGAQLVSRIQAVSTQGGLTASDSLKINLNELDLIFIRKDPPFDRRYLYTTLMLDFVTDQVLVLNAPRALRDWNEKLSALNFSEFGPKSLVASDSEVISQFVSDVGKAVIKPLDGFGGRDVQILQEGQAKMRDLIDRATQGGRLKIMVNEYIEAAKKGDKRILLLRGEPLGAILRKAPDGMEINNLDQGGIAYPAEITDNERYVCETLKPHLIERQLFFVGIDFLGDKLTEINVTSPTGLQELVRFKNQPFHQQIIESALAQL